MPANFLDMGSILGTFFFLPLNDIMTSSKQHSPNRVCINDGSVALPSPAWIAGLPLFELRVLWRLAVADYLLVIVP